MEVFRPYFWNLKNPKQIRLFWIKHCLSLILPHLPIKTYFFIVKKWGVPKPALVWLANIWARGYLTFFKEAQSCWPDPHGVHHSHRAELKERKKKKGRKKEEALTQKCERTFNFSSSSFYFDWSMDSSSLLKKELLLLRLRLLPTMQGAVDHLEETTICLA